MDKQVNIQTQSQGYFATDSQTVSPSWRWAPLGLVTRCWLWQRK